MHLTAAKLRFSSYLYEYVFGFNTHTCIRVVLVVVYDGLENGNGETDDGGGGEQQQYVQGTA